MSHSDLELPALFAAADQQAASKQTHYLRLVKIELLALVLAAALFEVAWKTESYNIASLVGFLLLVAAGLSRLISMATSPEKAWYDARAVAESVKTLAWQFAVSGSAFPKSMSATDSRGAFLDRMRLLLEAFPGLASPTGLSAQITKGMNDLRGRSLGDRKEAYLVSRVEDQLSWYSKKAVWNKKRGAAWNSVLLVAEILAAGLALGRGLNLFDVDWAGILGALAAVALAWRQTKQYISLSEAYSVTSHEVAAIRDELKATKTEALWAERVHDAESAFSREHTLWRARKQSYTSSR